ncbi:helix-turn-helix domain-containing protein [Streptomyces sp. PA5.6]|uniref:helix-turn-helix domain-containing protein n=1 Tax=Streptomyces sp. PA5.6 TaxID=3035651 RepID=UPI003904C94A
MRERAGLTARAAASLIGSNYMQQSHVESGRSGISEERIRRLAAHCACEDGAYVDALVAMATERGKGWWEKYRGIVAPSGLGLAELEHHAERIRTFQVAHIPGLLQTGDHMRAAFRYVLPEGLEKDLEDYVAFRQHRQQIIDDSHATPYEAVIHEAALRIRVGGRKATRAQLKRILEQSELSHVSVRVLPFASEDFAGAGHSMLYVHGRVQQLDTVQLDTAHGGEFLDAEPLLTQYRRRYDQVVGAALEPGRSREFIAHVLQEL